MSRTKTSPNPKPPSNDMTKVISRAGLKVLREMALSRWLEKAPPPHEQLWFECVIDFITTRGDEIVPGVLRDQEHRVIQLGKSQEYLAALADVVMRTTSPTHTQYDQTVLVLTATPEERAEALRKVLDT